MAYKVGDNITLSVIFVRATFFVIFDDVIFYFVMYDVFFILFHLGPGFMAQTIQKWS